ncbi:hypothetical protein D3C86_2000350 [compost metagenome]
MVLLVLEKIINTVIFLQDQWLGELIKRNSLKLKAYLILKLGRVMDLQEIRRLDQTGEELIL